MVYEFIALHQTTKSINYTGKTPEQHMGLLSWREKISNARNPIKSFMYFKEINI